MNPILHEHQLPSESLNSTLLTNLNQASQR